MMLCCMIRLCFVVVCLFTFFFTDTATTEIYTLSLHDALPILQRHQPFQGAAGGKPVVARQPARTANLDRAPPRSGVDRKSTRLNSSHPSISYAVFCLKKKIKQININTPHKTQTSNTIPTPISS